MKAVIYRGVGDVALEDVPEPKMQQPTDAIIRMTASAICGTDLHFIPSAVQSFPMEQILEKNLTLKAGNCNHRRYMSEIIEFVRSGVIHPEQLLTQKEPTLSAIDAYRSFASHERGWIKVKLESSAPSQKAA